MSSVLAKRTATVGACTLASRVLGLVRDVVIAVVFGAKAQADVFFVAFRIPNLFRRWFGEGAFSQAFVPVLSEYRETHGDAEVRSLVASVIGALSLVLVLFTLAGVLLAPVLVMIFGPGFGAEPEKFELAVHLLRLLFPYVLLVSLVALSAGVLNTYGRFAVPAFTPVFLNIGFISGALLLSPRLDEPITGLAYGVLAGGIAQVVFQLPALAKIGMLMRPQAGFRHPGVRKITRLMAPAMFGASVSQFNILIDTALASMLVTGSISWLYYADRMMEFPLGVFSIALGTVVLPRFSQAFNRSDTQDFSATLDWALAMVIVLVTPAAVGLAVLAQPILSTLFEYGAMTAHDVKQASRALAAYSIGLVALSLVKVLAPAYFSRQDTKTPVKVGIIAVAVNLVFNLLLIGPMKHAGLALATSLAAVVNAYLLYRGLCQRELFQPNRNWFRMFLVTSASSAAMAGVLVYLSPSAESFSALGSLTRVGVLAGLIVAGMATYFASLYVSGVRIKEFQR